MSVTPNLSEIIEWDVRNWSAVLDYWSSNSLQTFAGCKALEIGGRHGGLSLWLAMQGAYVVCSDKEGPTQAAVEKHRVHGVSNLV